MSFGQGTFLPQFPLLESGGDDSTYLTRVVMWANGTIPIQTVCILTWGLLPGHTGYSQIEITCRTLAASPAGI